MNAAPIAVRDSAYIKTARPKHTQCLLSLSLSVAILLLVAMHSRAGGGKMIASVVQRGDFAYAYSEEESQVFVLAAGDVIVGSAKSAARICPPPRP